MSFGSWLKNVGDKIGDGLAEIGTFAGDTFLPWLDRRTPAKPGEKFTCFEDGHTITPESREWFAYVWADGTPVRVWENFICLYGYHKRTVNLVWWGGDEKDPLGSIFAGLEGAAKGKDFAGIIMGAIFGTGAEQAKDIKALKAEMVQERERRILAKYGAPAGPKTVTWAVAGSPDEYSFRSFLIHALGKPKIPTVYGPVRGGAGSVPVEGKDYGGWTLVDGRWVNPEYPATPPTPETTEAPPSTTSGNGSKSSGTGGTSSGSGSQGKPPKQQK